MIPNYKLHEIKYIEENKEQFVRECYDAIKRFNVMFPNSSSTWAYRSYNTFSLTAGSLLFYRVFKDLKAIVRDYKGTDEPLWIQSWINFHSADEVLASHNHIESDFHGFFSVEPFDTKTVFEDVEIENKTGLLYIGSSYKMHEVVVVKPFTGKRITIAFDVFSAEAMKKIIEKYDNDINLSFIPI
jgi:hypothetical protein